MSNQRQIFSVERQEQSKKVLISVLNNILPDGAGWRFIVPYGWHEELSFVMCRQGTSLLCAARERYWWHHRLWGGFESICVVTVVGVPASHAVCRGSSLPCQWRWVLPGLPRLVPRLPHHTGRNLRPRGQGSFKDRKQHQKGEEPNSASVCLKKLETHLPSCMWSDLPLHRQILVKSLFLSSKLQFRWMVSRRETYKYIYTHRIILTYTSTQTSTYHQTNKGKNVLYGLYHVTTTAWRIHKMLLSL